MRKNNKNIILASASPRRIGLIKEWGLKFKVMPSHISEHTKLKKPSCIVKELALKKALATAKKLNSGVVIGADTIVVLKGHIIGKPNSELHSRQILSKLNGSVHRVYTGVAVIDIETGRTLTDYDVSRVRLRKLSREQIKSFSGKHMDKAGAYAVQEKDDAFVEKIFGDYYNVVGMPYNTTKKLLTKFKIFIK